MSFEAMMEGMGEAIAEKARDMFNEGEYEDDIKDAILDGSYDEQVIKRYLKIQDEHYAELERIAQENKEQEAYELYNDDYGDEMDYDSSDEREGFDGFDKEDSDLGDEK